MIDGTPARTGEAFGHEFAFSDNDAGTPDQAWTDEALDHQEPTVQEASTQEAPATQEPAPAVPPSQGQQGESAPTEAAPAEGTEQQPSSADPPQAQERLYGGRYRSVEQLEDGYKNIQRLQTRTTEQLQRAELERQQLRAALEALAPHLQQMQEAPGVVETLDPTQLSAQDLQRLIDAQVSQRVAQVEPRLRQQVQNEAQQVELRQVVQGFVASHPDAAPGSEVDQSLGEVIAEFQTDSAGERRADLFPITRDNLEVAYKLAKDPTLRNMVVELDLVPTDENLAIAHEAVQNPALAEVLLAQPTLVDSDHGIAWARKQAALPGMFAGAVQQGAAPTPEQARRAAYVETGGTGAPVQQAPGATPQDEMDEAVASWHQGRSNIFGLAVD